MHKIIVKKALKVNYNTNNKNEHKDVLCSMYDVLTQMILFIAGIQLIAVQLKITHIFHFFLTSIYSFIQKYPCESCAFFSHIYKIVTDFSRRYCCCYRIFKKNVLFFSKENNKPQPSRASETTQILLINLFIQSICLLFNIRIINELHSYDFCLYVWCC